MKKQCPKCNSEHEKLGIFCSRSCANSRVVSKETRIKIGIKSAEQWRINPRRWTEEQKKNQSLKMIEVVKKHPESYSKSNVSGRVKLYEVQSTSGLTKVKGTWELKVAQYLNLNKIKWTNEIKPFSYFYKDKWHLYFPDFYLLDIDFYLEVKGYKTDRDIAKWSSISNIKVLYKEDIEKLNRYNLMEEWQSHKL